LEGIGIIRKIWCNVVLYFIKTKFLFLATKLDQIKNKEAVKPELLKEDQSIFSPKS